MTDQVRPDDAARALAQIRRHQEEVINTTMVPAWYWWLLGGLNVALAAAVDSLDPMTIGIVVMVFVFGMLVGTGWVVRRARQVPSRKQLVGDRGVMMILGFVALVVCVTLAVALGLLLAGVSHPATVATVVCAVLLGAVGPRFMRALRPVVLEDSTAISNDDGTPRRTGPSANLAADRVSRRRIGPAITSQEPVRPSYTLGRQRRIAEATESTAGDQFDAYSGSAAKLRGRSGEVP